MSGGPETPPKKKAPTPPDEASPIKDVGKFFQDAAGNVGKAASNVGGAMVTTVTAPFNGSATKDEVEVAIPAPPPPPSPSFTSAMLVVGLVTTALIVGFAAGAATAAPATPPPPEAPAALSLSKVKAAALVTGVSTTSVALTLVAIDPRTAALLGQCASIAQKHVTPKLASWAAFLASKLPVLWAATQQATVAAASTTAAAAKRGAAAAAAAATAATKQSASVAVKHSTAAGAAIKHGAAQAGAAVAAAKQGAVTMSATMGSTLSRVVQQAKGKAGVFKGKALKK